MHGHDQAADARRPAPPARSDSIPAPAPGRADAAESPVGWRLQQSRRITQCGTDVLELCRLVSIAGARRNHRPGAAGHAADVPDSDANVCCGVPSRLGRGSVVTAIPLFAQTGAGLLEGTAAFGDWRADHPGTRRLIRPQDLPAPDLAASARNFVRIVHRTNDQKPIVPNGFEVNLFASGLAAPRLIRVAPNGDVFAAESGAGRIRVLRPERQSKRRQPTRLRLRAARPVRHRLLSARPRSANGSMSATPIPWSASPIATAT